MESRTDRNDHQRVVITGMGAVTPVGHSAPETWQALKEGRSGVGPLTLLEGDWPCQVAGELKGFDPERYLPAKKLRHMAHASQIAVIAADEALRDSGLDLDREDRDRIGVVLGTAGGSTIEEAEQAASAMRGEEPKKISPFRVVRLWPNMASYFVAAANRLRGYNSTVCTACASGTQAIGEAAEVIRRGEAEIVVTGGTESIVSKSAMAGFSAMRALAASFNAEPHRAMRPFDALREGFVAAQGGATLILESLAHAIKRGARIYAEVLGLGVSNDTFHMIEPDPQGEGAALALRRALASARVSPDRVDYINAHGTSTPLGDAAETRAIKSVFGERAYDVPISSTKSMIGHMMGAAGAVEAIACVMTIVEHIIHPTINYETPDPECDLDYVPNTARRADVRVAVSNSFGLGGQNAVLVLGAI
jgi:3-oxoacyl-[acyl-carrier-protein] synthase II